MFYALYIEVLRLWDDMFRAIYDDIRWRTCNVIVHEIVNYKVSAILTDFEYTSCTTNGGSGGILAGALLLSICRPPSIGVPILPVGHFHLRWHYGSSVLLPANCRVSEPFLGLYNGNFPGFPQGRRIPLNFVAVRKLWIPSILRVWSWSGCPRVVGRAPLSSIFRPEPRSTVRMLFSSSLWSQLTLVCFVIIPKATSRPWLSSCWILGIPGSILIFFYFSSLGCDIFNFFAFQSPQIVYLGSLGT